MLKKTPIYRKISFWRWLMVLGLVLIYCWLYWDDVLGVYGRTLHVIIYGYPEPRTDEYIDPIAKLAQANSNLVKFVIVFLVFIPIIVLFISQFILPVRTFRERRKVFWRLVLYAFGLHGPAIFVKEAKPIARAEELKRQLPGVVFVDMVSAIVLEKISKLPSPKKPTRTLMDRIKGRPAVYRLPKLARAEGPGITFMGGDERIRGVADLRRQFRTNNGGGDGVKAYTKDGIEVSSAVVITIFSLGHPPDVLKVAYVGDERPENIRVLVVAKKIVKDDQDDKRWKEVEYIKEISRDDDLLDLDIEDKREIHGFFRDRQQIANILEAIGEDQLIHFVRRLGLARSGPIERFINTLYVDRQAAYRNFVARLKPVNTETMHRFVINKDLLFQLVNETIQDKSEAKQVRRFINQLFTKYRGQWVELYNSLSDSSRKSLSELKSRFYTEQQVLPAYREPMRIGSSPFYFDERRVFAALYANARNSKAETGVDDWTNLTPLVATEYYRTYISHYDLDDLVGVNPDKPPKSGEAKSRYGRTVRYQGVLAYHLISRRDGKEPTVGDLLTKDAYLLEHPQLELYTPKVLRDRGIKVIAALFSDIRINDLSIRQQRLNNWQARWQSSSEDILSDFDIDIMHGRAQARAQAQRELIQNLSDIFSQPYTKEAMAVRIFQSLETAASDPATRRLLPNDTLNFIQNLRGWLMGGQKPPKSDSPPPPDPLR